MALNENPNNTSGKESKSAVSLTFPLNESLSSSTRLRFVKYDRFNPWDTTAETHQATITLPLPTTVPENYSLNIGTTDLGMFGNINNKNSDRLGSLASETSGIGKQIKALTDAGIAGATEIVKSKNFSIAAAIKGIGTISGADTTDAVQAFTGIVQNPHTTVMFNGVGLRTINLEWRFSPRSAEESQALREIYNTIKMRSHPEELSAGLALNYPDLVYIEFAGKAAPWLPKFQKAFISNFNITPDSSGGMALFNSGAPAIYNMQLSAIELSVLTRTTLNEQINGAPINRAGGGGTSTPPPPTPPAAEPDETGLA
jgi:hypothetical protein